MEKFSGLSEREAEERLRLYGMNELEVKKVNPAKIFARQFASPLIVILIVASVGAAVVSHFKQEFPTDSLLILAIIFISCVASFVQEYKAERIFEALRKLSPRMCKVIRDGRQTLIDARMLVPDDLVIIESGDIVPADCEIISGRLEVDESFLTGESRAVEKRKGDRIFCGSSVFTGSCVARVLFTGKRTEMGKMAEMLERVEKETPFQKEMKKLSRKLSLVAGAIIPLVFVFSVSKLGVITSILLGVSLAVAAIPESLPAVVTISFSLASKRMAKRNALIRKLSAIEAVGSSTVICTDKTGTLTLGRMKVERLWFPKESKESRKLAMLCCYACNDAKLVEKDGRKVWIGNEVDVALKKFSERACKRLRVSRLDSKGFTSERKMMSVLCEVEGRRFVFAKGAPEIILKLCRKMLAPGRKATGLSERWRKEIMSRVEEFARMGYRILALAFREGGRKLEEKDLTFVGLVVFHDPPRKGVKKAVEECYRAGIRVMMLTGDNPTTALAIARKIGLKSEGIVLGSELDRMSEKELAKKIEEGCNVFARINPFHKLKILSVLQKKGERVAMTGDGVNDALALKKAHVGIAMGIKGTEVAKEASDIVLLDDNFLSIRNAIEEGRRVRDNMRKFVNFLLSCNLSEVLVIFLGSLLYDFLLLYPSQILWINLVTDGAPAIALANERARGDVLRRKPREFEILPRRTWVTIALVGVALSLLLFWLFVHSLQTFGLDEARTLLFTGFVFFELAIILGIKFAEREGLWEGFVSNKPLVLAVLASFLLQFLILYTPLSTTFHAVALDVEELRLLFLFTLLAIFLGVSLSTLPRVLVGRNLSQGARRKPEDV